MNGPAATVVSGDPEQAGALLAACQRAGVRARQVPVDYASHCPQVEAIRDQLADALDGITPRAGDIPMVSAMTGQILDGASAGAGYWYANLRGRSGSPARSGCWPGWDTGCSSRCPRTRC